MQHENNKQILKYTTFKFSGVNSNGTEGLFSGVSRCWKQTKFPLTKTCTM